MGDLFFSIVNLSRFVSVNPDQALRRTIQKFIHRFQFIENTLREKDEKISEKKLDELESLWQLAKSSEG